MVLGRLPRLAMLAVCLVIAPPWANAQDDAKPLAPLLKNTGTLHHAVSTKSPMAQQYFDQGLRMFYAFNHAEAERSFRQAAQLDPKCAMAYWGLALTLGPNINDGGTPEKWLQAYEAIQKAAGLKSYASSSDRDYIDALSHRYSRDASMERKGLDAAYAKAMQKLAAKYPTDPDAGTLYAAAVMNTMPWDYWASGDQSKPGIAEAITALETTIKKFPGHPGAPHYYIHIVEASSNPGRAVPSADRLGELIPAAGHIVHMPSHIYARVGRWSDAVDANLKAVAADDDYVTQCRAQGFYPVSYYPHNTHFLSWSASMEGRSKLAIETGEKTVEKAAHHDDYPTAPWIRVHPATEMMALARFGRWDDILALKAPSSDAVFVTGVWHYARALAFAANSKLDEAGSERDQLAAIAKGPVMKERMVGSGPGADMLELGLEEVSGEIAAKAGEIDEAIAHLQKAVSIQEKMPYEEPPDWYASSRLRLGAVLLQADRPSEAEAVYRADLAQFPENGWALFGLAKSLIAQHKNDEASTVEQRFQKAWANADVMLTASRF